MKKAAAILLALVLAVSLFTACASGGSSSESPAAQYKAGTYTATVDGRNGPLTVEGVFTEDAIESLTVTSHSETEGISDGAIQDLPQQIVDAQSLQVDVVAGATMEADVVVAGSGLTGISAALAAQQEGASVILIEKLPFVGGISQTAAGGIAVPSENGSNVEDYVNFRLNQNAGIFKDTYVEGYPDETMVRTLAENSYDALTWLGENGLQYVTFDVGYQGYDLTYALFAYGEEWQAPNVGGYALTALADRFVENGGTLITECAATSIVMENGKVAGLKAEGNSGKYTFTCPSVVLATGGFGASEEMVEQYAPAYSGEYNTTLSGNTGDAITMGLEVGADVYTSGFMMGGTGHTYMTVADLEATYADHTTPKTSVYLNPLGLRVNSEDPVSYTPSANYVNPDGEDYYWAILNEEQAQSTGYIQYIDEIMASGGDAYKADSLDKLANMIRMPAANLRYSMNRYNQFCENGVDEDYSKSADYLVKMEEGPWYAVKATMTYFGTVGGLVTNENAEVLTPEGTAIPGLYTAGEASNGGFFNMSYSGGFALSIDATMGRISGTNAAKLAG